MVQVRFLIVALAAVLLALPEAQGNPFLGKKKKLLKAAKIGTGGLGKAGFKSSGLKGGGLKGGGFGGHGVQTIPYYVQSIPVVHPVVYQPVYQPVYHHQPLYHQPARSHAPASSFSQTSGLRDKVVSHLTDKVLSGGLGGSFLGGSSLSGGYGSGGSSYSGYNDDFVSSTSNRERVSFNSGSSSKPTFHEIASTTGPSHKRVFLSSSSRISKPEISYSDPEIIVSHSKVTYSDPVPISSSTTGSLVEQPPSHQARNKYARPDDSHHASSQPSSIKFNQARLSPPLRPSFQVNKPNPSLSVFPSSIALKYLQPPNFSVDQNRPSLLLTPPNVDIDHSGPFPPLGLPPQSVFVSSVQSPLPLEPTRFSGVTKQFNDGFKTQSNNIFDSKHQHQAGFFTSEVHLLKNAGLSFEPPSNMPSLSFKTPINVGPPSPYVASPPGPEQ